MANGLKLYYDLEAAENAGMDYKTFMEQQWVDDLSGEMRRSADRQIAAGGLFAAAAAERFDRSLDRAQAGIAGAVDDAAYRVVASQKELGETFQWGLNRIDNTLFDGFSGVSNTIENQTYSLLISQEELRKTFQAGFEEVSYQLGELGRSFAVGAANIVSAVGAMSAEVCGRLDAIHDTLDNRLRTEARERYDFAVKSYNRGEYEGALDDLRLSLKNNRTDSRAWFLLGLVHLGVKGPSRVISLEDAINALSKAVSYKPELPGNEDARRFAAEIFFYLGLSCLFRSHELRAAKSEESRKLLTEAQSAFERSYSYSDRMLESWYNVARCKTLRGDTAGALGFLRTLIERDAAYCVKPELESDFDAIRGEYHRLIEQMRDGLYEKAATLYNAISADYARAKQDELTRYFSSAAFFETHIRQGLAKDLPYVDMRKQYEELVPVAQSLAEEIRKAEEKLAKAAREAKEAREKAAREAEEARERAEREAEYERRRAEEAKAEEARRKAADREKAKECVKRAKAYCDKKYCDIRDYDQAIAEFTEAIRLDPEALRLDPDYAKAYFKRGDVYVIERGDNDRAIADFNEAIRLKPEYVVFYLERANAYMGKGDYDRAIADFNEVSRLSPNRHDFHKNLKEAQKAQRKARGGIFGLW
jgi:tetratricopeptide (TPR) repeat protein